MQPETVGGGTSEAAEAGALDGKTVALDPGHNGKNAQSPSEINRLVPDGRGGKKACNTTGTATADDFPEHAFNFNVAVAMRERLQELGAEVVMSRDDDDSVGPCVDYRGAFAKDAGADILLSIHANGSNDQRISGFGVITAPGRHSDASQDLAHALAAGLEDGDFAANAAGYGADGLSERTDLAGLNNAQVPAALVECGEMRNPDEAAVMESPEGQERYAEALVAGIVAYFEQAD